MKSGLYHCKECYKQKLFSNPGRQSPQISGLLQDSTVFLSIKNQERWCAKMIKEKKNDKNSVVFGLSGSWCRDKTNKIWLFKFKYQSRLALRPKQFTCSNETNFNLSLPVGSTPARFRSSLHVNAYKHLTAVRLLFVDIQPGWASKCKGN